MKKPCTDGYRNITAYVKQKLKEYNDKGGLWTKVAPGPFDDLCQKDTRHDITFMRHGYAQCFCGKYMKKAG